MELDELKSAWQALDHKLEQQQNLLLLQHREGRLQQMSKTLRPLFWGQTSQMLAGVLIVLLSVSVWTRNPKAHLFVAAILVHVYGVALILFGGILNGLIWRLDYSSPVLKLQQQIARLRRTYVIGGMCLGLPWWLLWIPFMMVVFYAAFGVDFYANAKGSIHVMLVVGLLGLLGTGFFHRWAMSRPELAKRLESSAAGGSLNRAKRLLEELASLKEDSTPSQQASTRSKSA